MCAFSLWSLQEPGRVYSEPGLWHWPLPVIVTWGLGDLSRGIWTLTLRWLKWRLSLLWCSSLKTRWRFLSELSGCKILERVETQGAQAPGFVGSVVVICLLFLGLKTCRAVMKETGLWPWVVSACVTGTTLYSCKLDESLRVGLSYTWTTLLPTFYLCVFYVFFNVTAITLM